MRMQNLPYGMADIRDCRMMEALADDAAITLRTFADIVRNLVVDHERALAELNADWSCTQEIADRFVRLGKVDFRSAHRYASRLVTWARNEGVTPVTITYADATRLWQEFLADAQKDAAEAQAGLPAELPLDDAAFRSALNPKDIVAARATHGSASPAETARLLMHAKARGATYETRLETIVRRRESAHEAINAVLAMTLARVEL